MPQYRAGYLHRGRWWVAWSDDVPGALTQGETLEEARENLKDAIRMMLEPLDLSSLPPRKANWSRKPLPCEAG